jgi:hypothetical protein
MKPQGAGAVMADHAPATVAADDAATALYRKLEYFPTPPWAARAGGELIRQLDPGDWVCWEPACGQGHMAHGLADYFTQVHATDIHDFSADGPLAGPGGDAWQRQPPLDFLSPEADRIDGADWIVTNPPFKPAAEFVRLGLKRARRGVAIFARSGWLETLGRYELFFGSQTPLSVEAPFFERVPLALGGWDPDGSTATPYSWFLFMKDHVAPPAVLALRQAVGPAAIILPIAPGTEARLTRPDDARRFGRAKAMPLFDGGAADG